MTETVDLVGPSGIPQPFELSKAEEILRNQEEHAPKELRFQINNLRLPENSPYQFKDNKLVKK
jgi:hypothetical protein